MLVYKLTWKETSDKQIRRQFQKWESLQGDSPGRQISEAVVITGIREMWGSWVVPNLPVREDRTHFEN
jgi:hypothetical protein